MTIRASSRADAMTERSSIGIWNFRLLWSNWLRRRQCSLQVEKGTRRQRLEAGEVDQGYLVWAGGKVDGGEGSDGDSSRNGGEELLLVRVHYGGQFGW